MKLNLKNKRILITGSSRGIGLSIAKSFLQEGSKTYLVSRGSDALFENEKFLKNAYGPERVFAFKCDCKDIESLLDLRSEIKDKWSGLDVVVINVGDGRSVSDALPNN